MAVKTKNRSGKARSRPDSLGQGAVVIRGPDVPMSALFEPWEMLDWSEVRKIVDRGEAVHVENASEDDEEGWVGCALHELGRQNVYAAFCHRRFGNSATHGFWIIPRSHLKGVLAEGYEHCET